MLGPTRPAKARADAAIRAFAAVVKQRPRARLEIYGRGPEEKELSSPIASLRLQNSVRLAGYTSDPAAVYRKASVCLLTSRYEGFRAGRARVDGPGLPDGVFRPQLAAPAT